MNKNVYFLKDMQEGSVDAIIIATESTAEEVQEIINNMKEKNDYYSWDDLVECLPADCEIYDRWGNNGEIYY